MNEYDVIIIGGGAAGLSAAIYCARYKLKTMVIAKEFGGLTNEAHLIENWPGEKQISGFDLMQKFKEHAESLGAEMLNDEIKEITKTEQEMFQLKSEGKTFLSKSIIFSLGTERRKLNLPEEEGFIGKGVSYCATCDGAFFKDKTVAIIGGSDSAGTGALLLSQYASKVYIIYRGNELKAEPITIEKIDSEPKIEKIFNANITKIKGEEKVSGVILSTDQEIDLDGIFVEIGGIPVVQLLKNLNAETDEKGYIQVTKNMNTTVKGLFAAGDITNGTDLKQIVTAAGQGATAAYCAFQYIKKGSINEH